ncbi:unnamed protein product [Closterium sp. NIES-54]
MPAERTLDHRGACSVPICTAGYEKTRLTVMHACTASGEKLRPWVWFKMKNVLRSEVLKDPSLFIRCGSTPFFVLVYVDDLVFATPDRRALSYVKEELQRRHTCTDLGELQRYLGLQITRDRAARTITLTKSHMVEQILMPFCFSVQPTTLAVDHGLTAPPSDEPFESSGPYPELVGCLIYLMTCTRPDLDYPLSVLAHFVAPRRHRPSHWYAAKRVAKYVASTSGMGLAFGGKQPVTLTGFLDLSWADDAESLCCEAEVYAVAMVAQELRWLSFLLTDLGLVALRFYRYACHACLVLSVMKSTPDRLHARLAHVGMNIIRSSAKHEVATGLDLKSASGANLPCVSCVGGKLARHTFPDQGSDADDVLAVVHIDLCGPFRVATKDGSM